MLVRSTTKYARISPKKARDVAREIQGLAVSDALDALDLYAQESRSPDWQDAQERHRQRGEQPRALC